MDCERWFEALSAIADGEEPAIDRLLVDRHLRGCAHCRDHRDRMAGADEPPPLALAPDPELAATVVRWAAASDRSGHRRGLQYLLVLVAVEILVLSFPSLILGEGGDGSAHGARHIGAFGAAYAVGLILVAHRPARARTMLVVGQVLAATLVISAIVGTIDGSTRPAAELLHLPELVSVGVLWLMTIRTQGSASSGTRRSPRFPASSTG